jgi:AcrR family transcriptional regulator
VATSLNTPSEESVQPEAQAEPSGGTRAARRKPSTNQAMREESIRRLSEAAFRLIVSRGYQATTLHQIAEAAGMTKGAVFFYFNSKENMLLHLLDIAEAHIVDPLIAHLAEAEGSAPDKIAAFYRYTSQHGIDRPEELLCLIKISIEFRSRGDAIDQRTTRIYDRIYRAIEKVLNDGKAKGEIAEGVPVRELASMVIATHDGMMLEWYRRGTQIDGRRFVRTVWSTFLSGIVPRTERPT